MIAIIPARGGSKGVEKKNIRALAGKPLIAYTIECALKSNSIDRVIVSTDDEEIAKVSREYGAEVPFMRPEELATDSSRAIDVYLHTIKYLREIENENVDHLVVLLPTCPMRLPEDIDRSIDLFHDKKADSVISYTEEHHPISWHKFLDEEGKFEDILGSNLANRQDLRTSYYPNGAIYVFSAALLESGKYYSNDSYAYVMPGSRSVDIDSEEDLIYAEYLLKRSNNE